MKHIERYIHKHWDIDTITSVEQIKIGFFNLIYKITTSSERFYLRIFQSESESTKINREIWITNYISSEISLSFSIPCAILNKEGLAVSSYLHSGFQACLIPEIAGQHPDLTNVEHMYESGRALGEFNKSIQIVSNEIIIERNPSYSDLSDFHPRVRDIRASIDNLPITIEQKERIFTILFDMKAMIYTTYKELPKQFIHGDYTNGNRLIHDGRISGMLDFEFFCWDARVMDLAIALGGGPVALWEIDDTFSTFHAFGKGYIDENPLEETELLAIPELIRLRRFAMFLYFMGRYYEGHDSEDFMKGIVDWLLIADRWIVDNRERLLKNIKTWTLLK